MLIRGFPTNGRAFGKGSAVSAISDTRELSSYRISPRIALRPGDRFRLASGTTYHGQRIGLRGVFELLRIIRKGNRVWFESRQIVVGGIGGVYSVLVAGRSYRRRDLPGVVMRPYRIRRLKRPPTERQLTLFDDESEAVRAGD